MNTRKTRTCLALLLCTVVLLAQVLTLHLHYTHGNESHITQAHVHLFDHIALNGEHHDEGEHKAPGIFTSKMALFDILILLCGVLLLLQIPRHAVSSFLTDRPKYRSIRHYRPPLRAPPR